ncbi:class I SAM-dependent methyltransferase [Chamaesiphon minutus]|uniref:Methylase involved in ubiquinone/menaquinone biosynthesis n=1 Tax=Chamaesiphon minutus (strain ATCC 27169 / PCC 6605) TaxID=1173020 RepID=K9UHY8_CHAP6|nr:class I SAM-dependent methyltransferase [Chamaesiphon minutus]AFY93804.1 methylase involved in ubiquinone/menaquinone biosynthesis [Chamaesiphon minutus PCC 6605]
MDRILEPEVMDTWQEATAYDAMDFTAVNTAFATDAIALDPDAVKVLDLGTGTARIPILMCQQRPQYLFTAIDLAQSMLIIGHRNVEEAKLTQRIRLERVDSKRMPYPDLEFDLVISNSLVHHLPEPLSFFQEIKRLIKPDGAILIRDLIRPENDRIVNELVAKFGGDYDDRQQQLFQDSLKAALTLTEVQELIDRAGLVQVKLAQTSELHWTITRQKNIIDRI